jgi:hypothetical protein
MWGASPPTYYFLQQQFMGQKIYVLGMAKSSLQLKTAGVRRNLELDVLRMIYCLKQLQIGGQSAKGYILVFNADIKRTIEELWLTKYNFSDHQKLEVLTFSELPKEIIEKIKKEKADNSSFANSNANYSKDKTEEFLKAKIESDFNINEYKMLTKDNDNFVIKINWDYYEILEKKSSR